MISSSCPYCDSKFKDTIELSKHIDSVHTGLGLLDGVTLKNGKPIIKKEVSYAPLNYVDYYI